MLKFSSNLKIKNELSAFSKMRLLIVCFTCLIYRSHPSHSCYNLRDISIQIDNLRIYGRVHVEELNECFLGHKGCGSCQQYHEPVCRHCSERFDASADFRPEADQRMSDEAEKMSVDEDKGKLDSFSRDRNDENKFSFGGSKKVGWITPAVKTYKNSFTPFPKRMNTFTEQIEKSKRFGEDEEYCCARVGCKNKIERERKFGESDSKYLSKYCSSECRKKAIFYSEDKENIDTSGNKSIDNPFKRKTTDNFNPFKKCNTVKKPFGYKETSLQNGFKKQDTGALTKVKNPFLQ